MFQILDDFFSFMDFGIFESWKFWIWDGYSLRTKAIHEVCVCVITYKYSLKVALYILILLYTKRSFMI